MITDQEVARLNGELLERLGEDAGQYTGELGRQFPRILRNVLDLWGKAQLDAYLHDLMVPTRDGRRGFPPDVAVDIMRLAAIHGRLGLVAASEGDVWQWVSDADLLGRDRA